MIYNTIKTIQARISGIAEINYVDENWGQLDYYSNNPPVKWPCALIDIVDADFSNIGMDKTAAPMQRQMGSYSVEIIIADMKLTNSSRKAPASQQSAAMSIWNIIELVHEQLHGWNPVPESSKLIRTGMSRVKRDDGVQEYTIIYSAELNNC